MKMSVLVDAKGRLLAVMPATVARRGGQGPTQAGLRPGAGQRLHEIEVPDELAQGNSRELFANYRVKVGRPPTLVAVGKSGGTGRRKG